jgi:regulatory protein
MDARPSSGAGVLDSEARLQRALDLAFRHLARRDRTVQEVRRHLSGREIDEATIERALAALSDQGYLDDARYARRFAEDRRALDGWGSERIRRRLGELGVPAKLSGAAVDARSPEEELAAALGLLRRRFPIPPLDNRGRNRALGLLVRRGYEPEVAWEALRAHGRRPT